jgi:hypothetical protein
LKGPSERLKYDLRRIWECPVCHHRERTGGDVTSCLCRCQHEVDATARVYMKLIEDGVRRVAEPITGSNSPLPSSVVKSDN